jgi:pimeloyl-ACP methyl ester carboxylesterase
VKNVYLIPGFLASDLGIASNHDKVWFDVNLALVLGIGSMALNPDGTTPLPPNGEVLAVDPVGQNPWPAIDALLKIQLDQTVWRSAVGPYDWRMDLGHHADVLTASIEANSTLAEPATIVAHSAGGIVAVLAWARLKAHGNEGLCRRIITLCTPFQGSYSPQQWMLGVSPNVAQLLALAAIPGTTGSAPVGQWALSYLNAVALTWPTFYELMPALGGSEAAKDPNRSLLYAAGNYDVGAAVSQTWLDFSRLSFQPGLAGPDTFPPDWVLTCVTSSSIATPERLASSAVPIALNSLANTFDGDGVVTVGSQTRSPSKLVTVNGYHTSVPLAITVSGLLAQLIEDPRGPLTPPPSKLIVPGALPFNTYDPPEADPYNSPLCIGGG